MNYIKIDKDRIISIDGLVEVSRIEGVNELFLIYQHAYGNNRSIFFSSKYERDNAFNLIDSKLIPKEDK